MFPKDADAPPWPQAAELGLADRFVVLYLGNTGTGHRFDTVLQAAAMLRDDPVTFLFVGGGSRWQEIERAARTMKLDNVLMHGYVPKEHTPSVMKVVHCALITLDDAALGVMSPSKLHSTLAMNLPILYVGPPGSNVDAAIQRYHCGFSVRHGDAARLAECIRNLSRSPADISSLRSRARKAFDDAYCDARTLPQFDELLDRLYRR